MEHARKSSTGGVLNEMENALFSSGIITETAGGRRFSVAHHNGVVSISHNGSTDSTAKPFIAAASSTSDSSKTGHGRPGTVRP